MANTVKVDDLSVTMELKNSGITLQVLDTENKHRGYLQINRGYLRWFSGKERKACGQISLDEFM